MLASQDVLGTRHLPNTPYVTAMYVYSNGGVVAYFGPKVGILSPVLYASDRKNAAYFAADMARRNDIETQASEGITDSTSVTVKYRLRFLVIPRQP